MTKIILILIISFTQYFNSKGQYNDKWISYYTTLDMELVDSLIILPNQLDTLIIPTPLIKNKSYSFNLIENDISGKIEIERINYTDLQYTFNISNMNESGIVTLNPSFYLGVESQSFEYDEYWTYEYLVDSTRNNCLIKISIMAESLSGKKIKPIILVTSKKKCAETINEMVFR